MSKFKSVNGERLELAVKNDHTAVRAVRLVTKSDINDTLVEEKSAYSYRGTLPELSGQIFFITDRAAKTSAVVIIPAPDFAIPRVLGIFPKPDFSKPEVRPENPKLVIDTCGYPAYVAYCAAGEEERLVRDWYREHYKPSELHAMSNTWGDRNGRLRVCDEFVRREIDSGADLGLDIAQIDDGWQKGIPEVYDENNNRIFEGDFWELKTEIFPNGMKSLAEYARARGIELGLWFAPHSRGVFEHFERDLSVLKQAYNDWSIRYFKLDMVDLPTREHADKMTELLENVLGLDGTSVELDVTAHERLGYLASAPYGTIFVENRYTAWSNYYPHRTLRNLWMLSRYIPTSKLQMELINPELCADKYSEDDPYCHRNFDIDYLFASVMFSNPLFWMETQFLSEKSRAELKSIIPIWKKHRAELTSADVRPIGEEPNGEALTGFAAECGDKLHILLFREATDRDTITVNLGHELSSVEVIAEKCPVTVNAQGAEVTVKISEPRSYVWLCASI